MTSPLSCQQLTVKIEERQLCQPLTLTIQPQQRWAILGKNGAGKSTLLHTLAGLRQPQSGNVLLYGKPLETMDRRLVAQQLGVLLQEQTSEFPGTVREHVLMGRHPHMGRWQWEQADDLELALQALRQVDLLDYQHRQVTTLSGGERQRLAVATLLCQQPKLVLLDEPSNHLDLHHQIAVLDKLTAVTREKDHALIMVIHDINLALRYCDHFLLLFDDGEHLCGPAEHVINEQQLSRLYQHPVIHLKNGQHSVFLPR